MEGLELTCFQMITSSGAARSCYIDAIAKAEEGNIDEAKALIAQGRELISEGHQVHMGLLQAAAADEDGELPGQGGMFLLIHAEDQMMAAEMFEVIACKFINLYENAKQ